MIEAVIFDLGGALLQLDTLDALAYGQAATALRPELMAAEVAAHCGQMLGLPRPELARRLLQQFELQPAALTRSPELMVATGWQALLHLRARAYERLLGVPEVVTAVAWQHRVALLYTARSMGCRVALVADTAGSQVRQILQTLALADSFDLVLTNEDVDYGLADPELYLSVAREFDVEPASCLAVGRSPLGVRAALWAGMVVLAVAPAPAQRAFAPFASHTRCVIVGQITALPGHLYAEIASRQPDALPGDDPLAGSL